MNVWSQMLLVAIGGAIGALFRFGIAEGCKMLHGGGLPLGGPGFPIGTMVANLLGCFLIGMLLGSGAADRWLAVRMAIGIGFLGSLTTFSTFNGEIVIQLHDRQWWSAIFNLLISVMGGIGLVIAGMAVARRWHV